MIGKDPLKQRIQNGEPILSLRVPIDIDRWELEAALLKNSYDHIYIDGQHTAFAEHQIVSLCSMAEELGFPVQFRIPHNREAYRIGRYLDLGISSVVVPEVVNPVTVQEAIDAAYYPPIGSRSSGGDARYGLHAFQNSERRREYAKWWNSHVVVAILLESVEAIVNARQLAVPGVDYVAFGPNDLQTSIDHHPEFPLRTPEECMQNVAKQLQNTHVRLGMTYPTSPHEREKFIEMGFTLFREWPQT